MSRPLSEAYCAEETAMLRVSGVADGLPDPMPPTKSTIPLRIRVGVTADGKYVASGGNLFVEDGRSLDATIQFMHGADWRVVAWHWITAEIPMPETEQGETKGEVEP